MELGVLPVTANLEGRPFPPWRRVATRAFALTPRRWVPTLAFVLCCAACSPGAGRAPAATSQGTRGSVSSPRDDDAPSSGRASRPGGGDDRAPVPTRTAPDAPRAPQEADLNAEPVASADVAPPDLPAGTTVLQIGDSFAGALGIDLDRDLKDVGVRGILKYQESTYVPTWASSKDLDGYLSRFKPDLVLITLGANELSIPDPAQRIPTIHRLVGRLGGRPCVWVAPPLWKGARAVFLDTIRQSCAPCLYLDSSALVPDLQRTRDHIHPSMQARKIWAKAVMDWLREHRDPHGSRPWDLRQ